MVVLRSRGEIVGPTETVQLRAIFFDGYGDLADLDLFPKVSITEPSGNVVISQTSIGVYRQSVGVYGFDYAAGINSSLGVWNDIWQGTLNGLVVTGSFNFVIYTSQLPAQNSDGYEALGDDPGFHYSQTAIHNINKLLKSFKARLNSSGKSLSKDQYGNDQYVDCDIYSTDTLVTLLAASLSYINSVPHRTLFTFDDTQFVDLFHFLIVQGAVCWALSSKALIERGREFSISDNSISFTPPGVSELLETQYASEFAAFREDTKMEKGMLKPRSLSLGVLSFGSSFNPVVRTLSRLRARQIW